MRRTPIRAVCFSVLTLACVLDVLVAAQTATLPFLGRWKFNPAKSDLQTTRLVFTQAAPGEMTMTMAGTSYSFRIDGTERSSPLESTATWTQTGPRTWRTVYRSAVLSTDGREVPVTGPPTAVPPGMTASLETTGPRTFDLAMKLKGVNVTTGHFTVAADGKSMSAETVSGPPGPTEERSKSFFERQ